MEEKYIIYLIIFLCLRILLKNIFLIKPNQGPMVHMGAIVGGNAHRLVDIGSFISKKKVSFIFPFKNRFFFLKKKSPYLVYY